MVDLPVLLERLQVPAESTIVVLDFTLLDWAREVRFHCQCQAGETRFDFTLMFSDCREIRWRSYTHYSGTTPMLVDLLFGTGGHRKPAQMLTDAFGVVLYYDTWHIERPDTE